MVSAPTIRVRASARDTSILSLLFFPLFLLSVFVFLFNTNHHCLVYIFCGRVATSATGPQPVLVSTWLSYVFLICLQMPKTAKETRKMRFMLRRRTHDFDERALWHSKTARAKSAANADSDAAEKASIIASVAEVKSGLFKLTSTYHTKLSEYEFNAGRDAELLASWRTAYYTETACLTACHAELDRVKTERATDEECLTTCRAELARVKTERDLMVQLSHDMNANFTKLAAVNTELRALLNAG
jgi:hypothetical protein